MESDTSEFSEREERNNYRSENLRGSLLECFKKSRLSVGKRRGKGSVSEISRGVEEEVQQGRGSIMVTSVNKENEGSLNSLHDSISVSEKPRSHPKAVLALPMSRNIRNFPAEGVRVSTTEAQNTRMLKPPVVVSTSIQTSNGSSEISTQTDPQPLPLPPPSPSPSLLSKLSQLQQQLFILSQKYRLQQLSSARLQSQLCRISSHNKQLTEKVFTYQHSLSISDTALEDIRSQSIEAFERLAQKLQDREKYYYHSITFLETQISRLEGQLEGMKNQIKNKESGNHEAYKVKLSKYQLQNQHLVSQLYLKSQQTHRYWNCLKQVGTYLKKTNIWSKMSPYYKEISFDFSLYD